MYSCYVHQYNVTHPETVHYRSFFGMDFTSVNILDGCDAFIGAYYGFLAVTTRYFYLI